MPMARVKLAAPLARLQGNLGPVQFSARKGTAYLRSIPPPSSLPSPDQRKARYVFSLAASLWASVQDWATPPWSRALADTDLWPRNEFMRQCMLALFPQFSPPPPAADPPWTDPDVTLLTPPNPDWPALSNVQNPSWPPGMIAFTWTARRPAPSSYLVDGLYRHENAPAWAFYTTVQERSELMVFDGLTPGDLYEFALVPYHYDSHLYGESTHRLIRVGA